MIALYLIAAHLIGDFLLQTRWQAMGKFGWTEDAMYLRAKHCLLYTSVFVPISWTTDTFSAGFFILLIFITHFLIDAQRFPNNPAELVAWNFMGAKGRESSWNNQPIVAGAGDELPPNPWPPMSLAIDQTLHIVVLVVLGGLFL